MIIRNADAGEPGRCRADEVLLYHWIVWNAELCVPRWPTLTWRNPLSPGQCAYNLRHLSAESTCRVFLSLGYVLCLL